MYDNELTHYGVKGMKWGVRRKTDTVVGEKRAAYKQAKKDYNRAYNKAYNYSSRHPIGQFTNKNKTDESDRRWEDAIDKADKLNTAKTEYKQAKSERRQQIKSQMGAELRKGAQTVKGATSKVGQTEIAKRGKSAVDVLLNGDSDWMGNKNYSDSATTELKNRSKAALERLMYSQEQIDNKKFFGRYEF